MIIDIYPLSVPKGLNVQSMLSRPQEAINHVMGTLCCYKCVPFDACILKDLKFYLAVSITIAV